MNAARSWAVKQLTEEIGTDFRRASQFTWFQSKAGVLGLQDLSKQDQGLLTKILPSGARFDGPQYSEVRDRLLEVERQAIDRYNSAIRKYTDHSVPGDAREHILAGVGSVNRRRAAAVAKSLRSALRKEAKVRGLKVDSVDPLCLEVSFGPRPAEFSIVFGLESKFVLTYEVVEVSSNGEWKQVGHYLGMLGIAASGWKCLHPEEAPAIAEAAVNFCEWHIEEMRGAANS